MQHPTTIDDYISAYPPAVQVLLEKMRQTIHQVAPTATEAISYGLPTFKLNGNLVHFGAFTHHIGFYPAPSGIGAFSDELAPYAGGKGTIKFPIDQPLPLELISKVVKFRVQENLNKRSLR